MKPIITVGMSLYNCENTIARAIDSIILQDFTHEKMQVIIADDGSKDHTLEIVQKYIEKIDIPTKVFQTKWMGLGATRNLIVENTESEYLLWLDSDQVLSKDYVRKQVEFMDKNSDVAITAGVTTLTGKNLVLDLELIPGVIDHFRYGKPKTFVWKTEKMPGTGGATFRLQALKQVNGFNEKLTGVGEDGDVAQRIRKSGWIMKFNEAEFQELHRDMASFKHLWNKYHWYGYGNEKAYRHNREVFLFFRMSPIAGAVAGFFYSIDAYKLFYKKSVFLLPIHYGFKMTAWMVGFITGQMTLKN